MIKEEVKMVGISKKIIYLMATFCCLSCSQDVILEDIEENIDCKKVTKPLTLDEDNEIKAINTELDTLTSRCHYNDGQLLKPAGSYTMGFDSNDEILVYNPNNDTRGIYRYQGNRWYDNPEDEKAEWSVETGESENVVCAYPYDRCSANNNVVTFDVNLNPTSFNQHDYFFEGGDNGKNCPVYMAGMQNISRDKNEGGLSDYGTNCVKIKFYCTQFVITPPVSWNNVYKIIVRNANLTNKFSVTIDADNNGTVTYLGEKGDYVIDLEGNELWGKNNAFMNSNNLLITLPPLTGETQICIQYMVNGEQRQQVSTISNTKFNTKYVPSAE